MADAWVDDVESKIAAFAAAYGTTYAKSEREISASFEIGSFHALLGFYRTTCKVHPENLTTAQEYRYLTTPSGNPARFSYVVLDHPSGRYELRQQVRIQSHLDPDIAFTPDLVVLEAAAPISTARDPDYAGGKRGFYQVQSRYVVAAHECKSMNPFPELLVSFLGMLLAAHAWLKVPDDRSSVAQGGLHVAPSLFVGGSPRALHSRMVRALVRRYPINIILGLHGGTWDLRSDPNLTCLVDHPSLTP